MLKKIYLTFFLLLALPSLKAESSQPPINSAYGTVGGILPGVGLGYRFQGPYHGFDAAFTLSAFLADLKVQYLYTPHYTPGKTSFYMGVGAVFGCGAFDSSKSCLGIGPTLTFGWLFKKSFFDITPQYFVNQNLPNLSFRYGWLF